MLLRQNVSFLMFPFTLMRRGDNTDVGLDGFRMPANALWKPAQMNVEADVFFAHIQSFLQKSVDGKTDGEKEISACDFMVYSCVSEKLNQWLFNAENVYELQLKNRSLHFSFYNDRQSFLSPKLVVYPDASVGLLMLPVSLKEPRVDMKMLMDFNYHVQKLAKQKKRIVLTGPERAVDGWRKNTSSLGESFYLADLVDYLLKSLNDAYPWQLFTPRRCHVFSYFNVCQEEVERAEAVEWKDDLLRIARCQNSDYQVMPQDDAVKQTFRNVYIAVNVEGGAMMTMGNLQFYQEFMTNNLVQRYLWLYVLVFIQRYSLINMARGIGAIDNDGDRKNIVSLKRLRSLSDHLTRIKVNSYFSDVSDYTQHNEFYHFCCKRLGVVRLLADVEQKMQTLDDCLRQKVEQRNEFMQLMLTIFVIFLTLFSGINDGLQLSDRDFFSFVGGETSLWVGRLLFACGIAAVLLIVLRRKK